MWADRARLLRRIVSTVRAVAGMPDYEAYVAELTAASERRPDHPATLYNLACAEALAGHHDAALEHLRRALVLEPEWAEQAARDDDFASIRSLPGWPP